MSTALTGQVTHDAAETYEAFFVPALFSQWTGPMLDGADVHERAGARRVVDVACGTGVLARAASARLGPAGSVTGIDPNAGMLAVASRMSPDIAWRAGRAEALPLDDASFDAVLCQFGLMFFDDRVAGLREMARVLRPGGRMAIAVWDSLGRCGGFAELTRLLERVCGKEAADALRAPFGLGDTGELGALFARAGIAGVRIDTLAATARFPSLDAWIRTNVRGWSFSELVDDEQLEALVVQAQHGMARFVDKDGSVAFGVSAHLVSARRP